MLQFYGITVHKLHTSRYIVGTNERETPSKVSHSQHNRLSRRGGEYGELKPFFNPKGEYGTEIVDGASIPAALALENKLDA
jgi:hypothetical protein